MFTILEKSLGYLKALDYLLGTYVYFQIRRYVKPFQWKEFFFLPHERYTSLMKCNFSRV